MTMDLSLYLLHNLLSKLAPKVINNFTEIKTNRVFRGGSWPDNPKFVRVANRGRNTPTYANYFFGFRCVK